MAKQDEMESVAQRYFLFFASLTDSFFLQFVIPADHWINPVLRGSALCTKSACKNFYIFISLYKSGCMCLSCW